MDDFKNFFVGAYATSPALFSWHKEKEIEFYNEIKKELRIRGLELPFFGKLHEHDEALLLSLLDKEWEYVLTCLPGTMQRLQDDPHFGLASENEESRLKAVAFYVEANEAVQRINNYFGARKVVAVALPSAPSLKNDVVSSSKESLVRSLTVLAKLDWQGAKLVIEHCDSGRESNPVKGFLSLEEEIEAVLSVNRESDIKLGITINWARSVLETRDVNTPVEHLKMLNEHGLLAGLMFSGTSDQSEDYGNWSDLHLPIAKEEGLRYYETSSLLNANEIKKVLSQCQVSSLNYIGVKVLSMPVEESSLEKRIGINRDTMSILKIEMENLHNEQ